ncbi:NERD domain-containing protein [Oceanobacillus sp. FSL K6-2867]|uniref:NERD domain-containing protein n=1 Tax=Oceanobacillus sp. FSL K6-2867 TaxID=2954748 RepID=UPI0030DA6CE1
MVAIAQLIKLQDYISRYEWDAYRYPAQYIRLKKDNWHKLYHIWEKPEAEESIIETNDKVEQTLNGRSAFSKLKAKFKRANEQEQEEEPKQENNNYADLPETEQELKRYFLNKLFQFQMKWATSTVTHTSFVDRSYYQDPLLRYLLQRLPDTYLVMYFPVFEIKNAPVETEILLISPIGIEVIHFLEKESGAVIMAGNERTWMVEEEREQTKILSPLIALKRTERLIRSILQTYSIDFSIKKTVLSRTNSIVFATEPYQTKLIDQSRYEEWFQEKRRLTTPLKSTQLKVVEALLKHCKSTSVRRPEWEEDKSSISIVDMEE